MRVGKKRKKDRERRKREARVGEVERWSDE